MEDRFPSPCHLRVLFPGARRARAVQAPRTYPAKQKPTAATWSRWGKCSHCVRGSRWQIINPLSSRRGIVYFTIALYLKEVLALNLNYTFNTPTRLRKLFGGPCSATRKVITREMGSCSRWATVPSRPVHYRLRSLGKILNFHQRQPKGQPFLWDFSHLSALLSYNLEIRNNSFITDCWLQGGKKQKFDISFQFTKRSVYWFTKFILILTLRLSHWAWGIQFGEIKVT